MKRASRRRSDREARLSRILLVLTCALQVGIGEGILIAQEAPREAAQAAGAEQPKPDAAPGAEAQEAPKIPPEQLDSLVAPIALYPDPLLAQTLVASTYPLEIIQLHQWMARNPELKEQALIDAVAKQPWDPAIKSMAALPEVVKRLSDDIQWTTDLGNAFLAQQADVMDAVQRMRKKAQGNGALESNEHQKVDTVVVEEKTVIVVESADPEVVYVPSYSPVVVYGAPMYPYPPIYYPPGAAFVSFSFGVMIGASWGGSCCGCGWGGNDIDINVDNNFNKIEHHGDRGGSRGEGGRGTGDRGGGAGGGAGGGGSWKHNPEHRGGAPYGDRATASKYGGSARGDSVANRGGAGQQGPGGRGPSASTSDRAGGGAAGRSPGVSPSDRTAGGSADRGGSRSPSDRTAGGSADRGGSVSGSGSRGGAGAGGSDRIGSRDIPKSGGSRGQAFGGGSGGYSGSRARSSGSRGASSMGGRGGRGGGGRR